VRFKVFSPPLPNGIGLTLTAHHMMMHSPYVHDGYLPSNLDQYAMRRLYSLPMDQLLDRTYTNTDNTHMIIIPVMLMALSL
jgi:hypothetical protein